MTTADRELDQLREVVRQNTRWNLVLVVLFIAVTGAFLVYQYYEFKRLTRPENLVEMAEEKIEENYADVREALKEQIIKSAPMIAEKVSKKAVASVPEAREQLVQFFGRELAYGLDEATELSADEFRQLLRENRDLVKEAVVELKEVPQETRRFVINLENRLEKRWDTDVQKEARFFLKTHRALNDKLEYLSKSDRLAPEQLIERRIVRILRAIQVRELGKPDKATALR